jgi:hypothetical protein
MRVFDEDFDAVAAQFKSIMRSSSWIALPGAVTETVVPSAEDYSPLTMTACQLRGYRTDNDEVISLEKGIIAGAISAFEQRELQLDDFTLTPGVSSGLLCIAALLKEMNISEVIFELPAYFAAIEQAELVGLSVALFPSSPDNGYRITPQDLRGMDRLSDGPVALIITQPRYGLGYNRRAEEILALREALNGGDVLIIDEAADQSFPSPLGRICLDGAIPIIRIRGLTKGLGLNSAKIAAILHPNSMREPFGAIVDVTGGALDASTLKLMTELAKEPNRYLNLLSRAQAYVIQQYKLLKQLIHGLPIVLAPIESGYLATAYFPNLKDLPFDEFRARFLSTAIAIKLPIVRGSSLYFPYDGTGEIIRINYFTSRSNMIDSGRAFQTFISALYENLI